MDEIDEEVEFHIAETYRALRRQGWTDVAARAEAERRFGDRRSYRRGLVRMDRYRWRPAMFFRDLRYACRLLGRQPAFTLVAILTLALGIGTTTAVFTIVNGVLLRPLPYRDPGRLTVLYYGHQGNVSPWFSPLNYRDYAEGSDAFAEVAALAPVTVTMTGSGDPQRLQGTRVSWNYFNVLGVPMQLGRAFVEGDSQDEVGRIVISDGLWRRQFGARPDVVHSTTTFDGRTVTIVGVAPPTLRFPATAEFWQPLIFTPRDLAPATRGRQWVQVLGRLKDAVSADQATTTLQAAVDRLAAEFPESEKDATLEATPLHDRIVGDVRPTLATLFGSVTLVVLIACANVASLLLARRQARDREVAVRAALGASRRQLIAQLLTESLVLGIVGGAAGAALAFGIVRALLLSGPASVPGLQDLTVDMNVLVFGAGLALVTSIASGLAPALAGSDRSFRWSSRGAVGAMGTRLRRILVISELAGAAMLLVGAGLLIRSYVQLERIEPGFEPNGVTTFALSLPAARYPDGASPRAFVSALLSQLSAGPGIASAAVATGLPFTGDFNTLTGFRHEGLPEPDSASMPTAYLRIVSPAYFETMRIPLVGGRLFDARERSTSPPVALINEHAAQRYFRGQNPVGRQIRVSAELAQDARTGPKTIVGVVGNIKHRGLDEDTPAEIYIPYEQHPVTAFTVAVRTSGDGMASIPALRHDVATLDPLLPLGNIKTLDVLVDASLAGRRLTMFVLLAFAGVALALSVIGVYGLLAYLVGQRRKETGLRLAIGASPSEIIWMFMREGVSLTLVGLGLGLAGALAAGRWIATQVFGVTPADPATFMIAAFALAAAALGATYVQARKAARVEPTEALRAD